MGKRVKGPDGKVINFPDNMDDASIDREMRKIYGGGSQQPPAAPQAPQKKDHGWSMLGSAGQGALQGLSFGFADEIEGFTRSMLNGEKYEDQVKQIRQRYKDAEEDNPGSYNTGDVGASVATAFIPGVGALGNAGRAASLGARAARGAAAGAALGGLRGAGDAQGGIGNTLAGAASGAALGGVTGGVLPVAGGAVRGAGRVTNNIMDKGVELGADLAKGISGAATGIGLGSRNPVVRHLADKYAGGIGRMADAVVDPAIDRIGQLSPRVAGAASNFYNQTLGGGNGIAARGALAHVTGGASLPIEAGMRAGAYGAEGLGTLAQSQAVRGAAAQQAANNGAYEGSQGQDDAPMSDEEILQRAQGTSFGPVLQEAAGRGDRALKSRLFVLKQNPRFRQELGL